MDNKNKDISQLTKREGAVLYILSTLLSRPNVNPLTDTDLCVNTAIKFVDTAFTKLAPQPSPTTVTQPTVTVKPHEAK